MNPADVFGIILVVGFILGLMTICFSMSILSTSSEKSKLEAIDLSKDEKALSGFDELIDWAAENEYLWIDAYWGRFPGSPSPLIVAWQHEDGTYLASYKFGNAIATDFFTVLDEDHWISLTTSKIATGEPHPKMPGSFSQFFKHVDFDTLEKHHHAALEFLESRLGLHPQSTCKPFEDHFLGWVRKGARYVKAQPMWMFRGLIWYIKRNRYRNIPVSQRYANITNADLPI